MTLGSVDCKKELRCSRRLFCMCPETDQDLNLTNESNHVLLCMRPKLIRICFWFAEEPEKFDKESA